MPLYRCIVPKNSLDYGQRQEIAEAFTNVHCGISAAPRSFVHVWFIESGKDDKVKDSHGDGFLDYKSDYYIAGGNRAGRPPEVRKEILGGLIEKFCEISGADRENVSGHISERPASWTMEAGHILPEPGQEPAEWYEHETIPG